MARVEDARSHEVAFVAHCLLNQSAKAPGLAGYAGVFEPLLRLLVEQGVGVIQMPCPEVAQLGVERPLGTDTREQYDTPDYRSRCEELAGRVASEVALYRAGGCGVVCLLGVEGSPSCSVSRVPRLSRDGARVLCPGPGLFVEALSRVLEAAGLDVPMIGVPEVEEAGDLGECLVRVTARIEALRTGIADGS